MPSSSQACALTCMATKFLRLRTARRLGWGAAWACGTGRPARKGAPAEHNWKKVRRGKFRVITVPGIAQRRRAPVALADATQPGTASVRSCERIGWQAKAPAKAPAPQKRKPLCTKVGQTLSSVNPAISAILSQLLSERPLATGRTAARLRPRFRAGGCRHPLVKSRTHFSEGTPAGSFLGKGCPQQQQVALNRRDVVGSRKEFQISFQLLHRRGGLAARHQGGSQESGGLRKVMIHVCFQPVARELLRHIKLAGVVVRERAIEVSLRVVDGVERNQTAG